MALRIFILAFTVIISGCHIFNNKMPRSCVSPFVSGGKVTMQGLEIPIGSAEPIKLGQFIYDPEQLQMFSDTAVLFEIQRQQMCVMLETMLMAKASAREIKPIVFLVGKLSEETSKFIFNIQYKGNPEKIVDDAQKGIEDTKKELEEHIPDQGLDDTPPELTQSLHTIKEKLNNIEIIVSGTQPINNSFLVDKFIISGFAKNSAELTDEMKKNLRSKLLILEDNHNTNSKSITYDIIGYADGTGSYISNVRLGLERAQSVASAINEHTIGGKSLIRVISSGGISQLPGELGRNVEILSFSVNSPYYSAYHQTQ